MIFYGFYKWYYKVQKIQDQILLQSLKKNQLFKTIIQEDDDTSTTQEDEEIKITKEDNEQKF